MLAACAELNELPLAGASRWLQWGPGRAGCWRAAVSSAGSEHRCVASCHRQPSREDPGVAQNVDLLLAILASHADTWRNLHRQFMS